MSRHIVEQRDKKKGGLIDLIFQVDRVRDDRGTGARHLAGCVLVVVLMILPYMHAPCLRINIVDPADYLTS